MHEALRLLDHPIEICASNPLVKGGFLGFEAIELCRTVALLAPLGSQIDRNIKEPGSVGGEPFLGPLLQDGDALGVSAA